MKKRRNCSFLLFSPIFCYLLLDFHVKTGIKFSLRDKRLFEISEVEITRVYCINHCVVVSVFFFVVVVVVVVNGKRSMK